MTRVPPGSVSHRQRHANHGHQAHNQCRTIVDTGNARYLWIRVGANADRSELIVTIGHELQHALEVLSHTNVRSRRALLEWYRFGESQAYGRTTLANPFRSYETTAAIDAGDAVRSELADRSGGMTGIDKGS
jgi:hypothetical protein